MNMQPFISPIFLKTFCRAYETKNFTMTAKDLGMTQSGVSQHISSLEEIFGIPLFRREGRNIAPTSVGERLYASAGSWLSQMDDLIHDIRDGDLQLSGKVVVGAPGSYGVVLLPAVVAWQQKHPEISVDFVYGPREVKERELSAGRMDLGITGATLDPRHFLCEELFHQEFVLVSHPDLKVPLDSWKAFKTIPFIDYVGSEVIFQRWIGAHFKNCADKIHELNVKFRINNMEGVFQLIERKVGVTIFPREPLEMLNSRRLKIHNTGKSVKKPLYLCQRLGSPLSRRVQAVKELILKDAAAR